MSLRITANSPAKSTDFPAKTNTREGSGPPGQTACFSLLYSFLEAAFYTVKLTAFFPDSYYSDKETGFYYLQSRYYDPILCRFINADSYASTGQGFLGYNMFAYCHNCPTCSADPSGTFSIIIVPPISSSDNEANKTYTDVNVNIYMAGVEQPINGKLNICFYDNGDGYININVENSLTITNNVEQREILKLITQSRYYEEETYGDIDFMQAQWIVHNAAYSIANTGEAGEKIVKRISGATNPINSSQTLDLRPKNNMGRSAKIIYKIVSCICHSTSKYPSRVNAEML